MATRVDLGLVRGPQGGTYTKAEMLKLLYPIGTILEFGQDTDPNTLTEWLGVGWSWERYAEGRVTVGYQEGDSLFGTVGNTGGSKDAEVISHRHPLAGESAAANYVSLYGELRLWDAGWRSVSGICGMYNYVQTTGSSGTATNNDIATINASHSHALSGYTAYTGGSGAGKNMPPYKVTAKWIRIT